MSRVRDEANGQTRKKSKKASSAGFWKGFIEVNLTAAHKSELAAQDLETEYPYSMIEELLESGYKVSFAFNEEEGTHRVTLVDVSGSSAMQGFGLSGRGSTTQKAFAALIFKHVTILDATWAQAQSEGSVEEYG